MNQLEQTAAEIGEDIGTIGVIPRQAAEGLLGQGVIVKLTIGRFRGVQELNRNDLGIQINADEARFYQECVRLGHKKVLPSRVVNTFNRIEQRSRGVLKFYSIESLSFGHFVPAKCYKDLKAELSVLRDNYFAENERLVHNLDEIRTEVTEIYTLAARQAYDRMNAGNDTEEPAVTRADFIASYVDSILSKFPTEADLRSACRFEWFPSVIPAVEGHNRDEIVQKIMDDRYTADKQAMITEFVVDVQTQINTLIIDTVTAVERSMKNNNGHIIGKSSKQLQDFMRRVDALNFYGDIEVEAKIARLRGELNLTGKDRSPETVSQVLGDLKASTETALNDLSTQIESDRIALATGQVRRRLKR